MKPIAKYGLMLAALWLTCSCAERLPIEAPHNNRVTFITLQQPFKFSPNVDAPQPNEMGKLTRFISHQAIGYGDQVALLMPVNPTQKELNLRRANTIRSYLEKQNLQLVSVDEISSGPVDDAVLVVGRYLVVPTDCPKVNKSWFDFLSNESDSNFGCATSAALGSMIADPRDLIVGREPKAGSDGTWSALAVDRYRQDKIKKLQRIGTQNSESGSGE